ncbi:Hypothetical Protein FCC1311_101292 [Hondaea fermentalgiana]|uniref:Uncharacterized protein n=1 Tax=Hondaea fermentalgiana TaxID=2315210 RepID=A0A2R5GSQ3_9STRA|nr:Hypothetical Protein FCC1311_101292 [Hondaea fermentalgiana]|eukprot:GBG33906.1 Hypothetical Protein FCC1311_101292 [Hondaea fermentalgiana]
MWTGPMCSITRTPLLTVAPSDPHGENITREFQNTLDEVSIDIGHGQNALAGIEQVRGNAILLTKLFQSAILAQCVQNRAICTDCKVPLSWNTEAPSRKGDAAAADDDGRKGGLGDVRVALRKLQRLEEASRGGGGQEGVSDAQVRKDARDRLEVASMELWTSQRVEVLQAARSVSAALNVLRIAIDCGALRSESANEVLRLRKKLLEIYMLHRKSLDVENTSAKALVRHKTMCDLATLCVTRMVEAMSPESVDVDLLRDLELLARENVAVGSQSYRLAVRAIHLTDFIIGELGNMYANAGEVPEEDKQSLTPCLRYALKILFRPRKKEILRCSEISLLKGQWLTIPWSEEGKLLYDKSFRSEIEGRLTDMPQRIQVALNGKNGSLESPVPEASVIETELQQLGWEPVPNEHDVWRKQAATSDRIGLDVVRGRAALHALWLRCSAHAMSSVNVKSEPSLESNDTAKALAGNPKGNGKMATVADSGHNTPPPPFPPLHRQGSTNSIALTQASQISRWGSSVDAVTCRPESVLVLGAACMAYVGYPDHDTSAEAREQCINFNNAVPGLVKACKEPEAALPAVRALLVSFLEQHLSAGALDCRPGLCKKVVHNVAYLMSLFTAICRASDQGDFKVKCFGLWTQLVAGLKPGLLDDLDVWDLVTAPIFRASNAIAFFKDRATNQVWMATFLFRACDLAESVEQPRVRRSARRDRIIALKDMDIGNPVDVTEVHRSSSMVQRVWETRLELCVHTFVWAKGLDLGTSKYIICEEMVKTYPREGFAAIKRDKQLIKVLGGLTEVLHVLRSLEPDCDASWLWKVVRTWYPGASVLARSLQDSLELLALCLPPSKHARSFNMLVRAADKDNALVKQIVQSHELLLSVLSHHGFEHPDFSPKHVIAILRELALPIRSKRAEIQTLAMQQRNFYAGLTLLFATHGETLHEVILLTQRTSRASAILAAQRNGADDESPYIDLAACASQDSLVSEPGATRGKALFSYPDACQRVTIGEDELVRVSKPEEHFTDAIVQFYFQWCMLEKYPSHRAAIERGIFCFDALFFSKMLDSYASTGLDSVYKVVGNWYASLGATIFEKDIWAIPVVHEEHCTYEILDADWTLLGKAQMRMQSKEAVDLFLDESDDDDDDAGMHEKDKAATLVNEEDENNDEHGILNVLDDISEESDHQMDAKKDTVKETEEKLPAIPTLMAGVNEAEVNKAEVASKARKRGLMHEDPRDAQEPDGNAALRPRIPEA